jgi:hypothetical protein
MVNQVHRFKHRDVVRAVKAVRAAGLNVHQVAVDPHTGAITIGSRPDQGVSAMSPAPVRPGKPPARSPRPGR